MHLLLAAVLTLFISFDGLKPEYITPKTAPNIYLFQKQSASARYMESAFPASTFPNHASLMTGCTAGEHGIVSNQFIDPKRGKFKMEDDSEWQECEPLWAAASRAGKKVAIYTWPIAQTPWHGAKPAYLIPLPADKEEKAKFFKEFDNEAEWKQFLDWMSLPRESRPELIFGYFPDVDSNGHKYGPSTPETMIAVKNYDRRFGQFLKEIKKLFPSEKMNIVFASDHGMARGTKPIETEAALQTLQNKLGKDTFDFTTSSGTIINLYFKNKKLIPQALEYLKTIPAFHVYSASQFPSQWNYHNKRSGDIIVTVDEPYFMVRDAQSLKDANKGYHGYDPKEADMRAFFAASGPDFSGAQLEKIRNIDVAPTIAKALHIPFKGKRSGRPVDEILTEK